MNLQNITKDSIIKAIKEIDSNPKLRYGVSSSTYDVLFDNKRYPPKLIISIAYNKIENKSIKTASFRGGLNSPCFNVLEKYSLENQILITRHLNLIKNIKINKLVKKLNLSWEKIEFILLRKLDMKYDSTEKISIVGFDLLYKYIKALNLKT